MTQIASCVLVEGLDLAGKTSACHALAATITPAPDHRRNALTRDNILYTAADEVRRARSLPGGYLAHAYLAALALDLRQYRPPSRMTIQESTIGLRSFAHYRARGDAHFAQAFARLLDAPEHPRFDGAIVLTANIDVRLQRLEMRRREAPHEIADDDLVVINTPRILETMERILIEEATKRYRAVVIDTSDLSKAEVVEAMKGAIGAFTADR